MIDHGHFSGDPKTLWQTEEGEDRHMTLLEDFWFSDPAGRRWPAERDYDRMDGASIPRPLWSLIGSPYTGDYRRASIVHDKACEGSPSQAERRAADRMFYHACRTGGCSVWEATLLYIGVRIGAWVGARAGAQALRGAAELGPRIRLTAAELRLIEDFQLAVELVAREGLTDDPADLERSTDRALADVERLNHA
jgi:hypothetical protein